MKKGIDTKAQLFLEELRKMNFGAREASSETQICNGFLGSEFELVGPIHETSAAKYGLHKEVIEAFKDGFPMKWKNILKLKQRERPAYLEREEKRKVKT